LRRLLHGSGVDAQAPLLEAGGRIGRATDHLGKNAQRIAQRVHGVEQRLFVFLVVFVVGQRLGFHQHQQAHQVTDHAPGLAARKFGYVGVFLLRHDRAAGGVAVGQRHKAKVLAHPDDQLFAQAAQVHHAQAGGGAELERKVAVAHGVEAVEAQLRLAVLIDHAQRARHALAVQRVAGAGQRRAAQRQPVGAPAHVGQALGVARKHLDISQQMVRKTHRLRHLEVGKAGHDHFHMLLGHLDQGALQLLQQRLQGVDLVAQPQAHVGGHLVVAAAAGVQALAGVAHELRQARFDVQVYVFELELPLEAPSFNLGRDAGHAALDGGPVGGADDALRRQHLGVR